MFFWAKFLSKIISILYQSNLFPVLLQTDVLALTFKEKTVAYRNFRGLTSQIFTFCRYRFLTLKILTFLDEIF